MLAIVVDAARWQPWLPSFVIVIAFGLMCVGVRLVRYWREPRLHSFMPMPNETRPRDKEPPRPAGVERRSIPRVVGETAAVVLSDEAAEAEPHPATVVDRANGGIALTLSRPMEPGCRFSMRLAGASGNVPWALLEVRYCNLVGGHYRAGARFLRTPPWVALLLFDLDQ